jgi:hypothetical protein
MGEMPPGSSSLGDVGCGGPARRHLQAACCHHGLGKEEQLQGRILQLTGRLTRKPLTWIGLTGLTCGVAAFAMAAPAQATPYPPSTSSCQYSNSATPANSAFVVGVTPGSTITISCTAGSFADSSTLLVLEASGLAGIVSPSSAELDEVDIGSLQAVSTGADGSLNATYTVPTAYSAADPNAQCPAPQAQINVGLGCNLVIINTSLTPVNEAQVTYQGQGTPNRPTLRVRIASIKRGVKTLTASDVPGACPTPVTATSHCWWGAPNTGAPSTAFSGIPALEALVSRHIAKNTLQVTPTVYCQAGATAAACSGLPAGTLVPPALSGTMTVTRGIEPVTIDEPNTTPYSGNGTLSPLMPGTTNVQAIQLEF